jgi:uncharacterized protein YaaN involved in tellurite resistance
MVESTNNKELTPIAIEVKPAVKPENVTDQEAIEIKAHASQVVAQLLAVSGSEEMTVADSITNVGIQDQKTVSSGIALLQERMGNIFYSDNKNSVTENMSKDITQLQGALAKVNPDDIKKETRYKILTIIPFFGNRIINILKVASDRRLTLQEFVDHLQKSLESGETILRQDNAQLKVMYEDIEKKQLLINQDAYFAEVLMEELDKAISECKDDKKKGSLQKVLFKVATRAQDLRAMENVHEQFFISIDMTRDNNDMLLATVQRMLSMGMNVINIAFAIHAALARQQNVIDAEKATRDFIGNLLVANATAINGHVKEIGDLYKEPVIAMDKLAASVQQLEQAIDATNKLKAEGIETARANIVKIKDITNEIKNKANLLPDSDVKSLEASKTLALKAG